MELIDNKITKRATRAIKCLPLNLNFYDDAKKNGLNAGQVFEFRKRYSSNYKKWFSDKENLEKTFEWLIIIGVLRREVDGQGLTSKIRLTPLGRKIIENNPALANNNGLFFERIKNFFTRISII